MRICQMLPVALFFLVFAGGAGGDEKKQQKDKKERKGNSLFDGKTLEGWEVRGGTAAYRVEDGIIVGTTVEGSPNTFLCTRKEYSNFELELDVRCDPELNSGIQIRSHVYEKDTVPPGDAAKKKTRTRPAGTVYGYQCEIASQSRGTAGNFWDEARHTRWHDDWAKKKKARSAFKDGEWNHYRILARGDQIRSWVNGVPCANFTDSEDASGFIGLQVHGIKKGTGPLQVRWKNVTIRELRTKKSSTSRTPATLVWTGTWQSAGPRGHGGELKCVAEQVSGKKWKASFTGYCNRQFAYEIEMAGTREGKTILFTGDADLGEKDGKYKWTGEIKGNRFVGEYRSANGKTGKFEMEKDRVASPSPAPAS